MVGSLVDAVPAAQGPLAPVPLRPHEHAQSPAGSYRGSVGSGSSGSRRSSLGTIASVFARAPERLFTRAEVRQHATRESCWLIVGARVYDVTEFLKIHPAGEESILRHGGEDATVDFDFHSSRAQGLWRAYEIGRLVPSERPSECGIL